MSDVVAYLSNRVWRSQHTSDRGTIMNANNLGDLRFAKAQREGRYGRPSPRHDRPGSSLAVIARMLRRERWDEQHPGQSH